MKESLNIEQKVQTVQRLSPRQVQFVRLLEMNAPEIEEEIQRQIDDNPAIEVVDHSDDHQDGQVQNEGSEIISDPYESDPDDDPADRMARSHRDTEDSTLNYQIVDDDYSLYNALTDQLSVLDMPDIQRQLAMYIIGNLDDNGYMTRSLTEMADDITFSTGTDITYQMMRQAFDTVRTLDPPGICAVDLRDCLLLQLRRMPETDTTRIATEIVEDYFDLFSKMHYDRLQSRIDVSSEQLRAALDLIRSLNPKPGSAITATQSSQRIGQITPDIIVEQSDDGRFILSLASSLPQLQIEKSFDIDGPMPSKRDNSPAAQRQRQAQAFVKLKRDDAEAFIGALKQRSATLLTVGEAIVRMQHEFFETGDKSKLRPMILKDIATATGLDISVISRATAGKYIATSTGTYPLKQFFSEAQKDSADISTHRIQHEIQQIIDNEDKRHPLSDEAIRDVMADRGYNLARRTITKYREAMQIPVGRLRKSLG